MPIKRRDRENSSESNNTKPYRIEHMPTDHELFLQAFEKPTQIYRYLRSRNRLSPIFLHRNLTYMKDRATRPKSKKRQHFRIDSLLQKVENQHKSEDEKNGAPNNFMTLMFLGFYDKFMVDEQYVNVEIIVSKISQMKRKDSFKSQQDRLGSSIVKINPVDMIGKVPAVSIPTDLFKPAGNGLLNSSCNLQLILAVLPHFTSTQEPVIKTHDQNARTFETELVIFDKHNRCTLSDGEYELTLQECSISPTPKIHSPKKHPTWEVIPENCLDGFNNGENPLDDFTKSPTLKFRLSWTNEKYGETVDRPLPITIRKDDYLPKENGTSIKEPNNMVNGNCIANGIPSSSSSTALSTTNHVNSMANSNANTNATITTASVAANTNATTNSKPKMSNATLNGNGTNASMIVKLHDIASRIIYHFIYNNNSSQQTETFDNFNCPWCCLHCLNLYALLKHLKLCHARFNFTYVPTPNGVRVDVSINEQFDGSYIGSPHDLVGPASSAFARAGPVRRTVVTRILVCHPRRPKHSLTEFLEIDENELNNQRPYVTGHNRLYHHTMTCLPVHPKGLDIDSEDETDPAWLQQKTMQMLDEFTDVNDGEKEIMKMWNLHTMRNGYVGDIQVALACEMFVESRGRELLDKNLYRNYILHLCNFFDYGLFSPDTAFKMIQKLQRVAFSYPDGCKNMATEHEKQMDYWETIGKHKQPTTSKPATVTTNSFAGFRNTLKNKMKQEAMDSNDGGTDETKKSPPKKTVEIKKENDGKHQSDDDNSDDEEIRNGSKMKKNAQNDLPSRSNSQTDFRSTAKERNSMPATTKKKTISPRNSNSVDSPPRRRSASAALQLSSNTAFTAKRRNSTAIAQSPPSAIKKGKRLSLSIPKL